MKTNILSALKPFVVKYEPEILMTMGLSGLLFSTVWGIKATIKAVRIVDEKKQELKKEILSGKEIVKAVWKLYIPVVAGTVVSIPCIILGNHVSARRNMALAAAYTISETALQEYQEKTKELVGPKKEQEIHEAVSKDSVSKTYPGSKILLTGDGDSLFHESLTGRYFKSNWNKIVKIANELNSEALTGICGEITLTQWFDRLGLPETDISDTMGWIPINGKSGMIDISIDSVLTPDDIPCGSIHYNNMPKLL